MLNLKTVNVMQKRKWFISETRGALTICNVMKRDISGLHVLWLLPQRGEKNLRKERTI